MLKLNGPPSDDLPDVLAVGTGDARFAYMSFQARNPEGRDADYIEWHTLDHRPEQYRIPELRASLRVVSTPECRAQRAVSDPRFDATDHVITYLFAGPEGIPPFMQLGAALMGADRMQVRTPYVGAMTADVAGMKAAPRAAAGAHVLPWRPCLGVYLIVEEGQASAEALVDVPGVAGAWWWHGAVAPDPGGIDGRGWQVTFCYLDEDPPTVGARLREAVQARWASGEVRGLLAAPFFTIVPFEWTRHLP